jgi:hypothetical protein
MRPLAYWLACGLVAIAVVTGCGRKAASTDDGHKHAEGGKAGEHKEGDGHKHSKEEKSDEHGEGEKSGVAFKEGRGLTLNPDIIRALALKTAEAEERPLAAEMTLLAQVFAATPQVVASASVPEADADRLEKQTFTGAKLVRVDRASATATRRVDAVFAVERNPAPKIGEFVELKLASEPTKVLSVPRSAILDAATGTFVYVVNGEHYLRTAVKLGARSADFVEVTDGLYSGDVVVTTPVNQLWLSELRLTKGGGHSH